MRRGQVYEVRYETREDEQHRLGAHSTLVLRYENDDYTVLGLFPSQELADMFLNTFLPLQKVAPLSGGREGTNGAGLVSWGGV